MLQIKQLIRLLAQLIRLRFLVKIQQIKLPSPLMGLQFPLIRPQFSLIRLQFLLIKSEISITRQPIL